MTERGLVGIAAAGALIVAYVVYSLMARDMAAPPNGVATPRGDVAAEQTPRTARRPSTRDAPETGKPRINPVVRSANAAPAPPPTPPKPEVSLEEARDNYDALVAELDREAKRTEDTGRPLPSEAWVDYYTQMHAVMDPLRLHLSWENPDEKEELREKSEELRKKLDALQAPAVTP